MLRGLGLLLPVLVLGGLLHSEVGSSGACKSLPVPRVLSGDENSAAQVLWYKLMMILSGVTKYYLHPAALRCPQYVSVRLCQIAGFSATFPLLQDSFHHLLLALILSPESGLSLGSQQ